MSELREGGAGDQEADRLIVRSLALRPPSGHRIDDHKHDWSQIVYAARGALAVEVAAKRWVVPPQRCLWLPAGIHHAVETVGETWMRMVYLRPWLAPAMGSGVRVLEVAPLLRELLLEVVRLGLLSETDELHTSLARLQHAVRRLAEGMKVTEVAGECGYESLSAFVTMFRRSFGVTPGKYLRARL